MSGCSWPNFYSNVSQRVFLTDPPSPKFNVGAILGSSNLQNFFRSKAPPITTPLACRPNLELGGRGGQRDNPDMMWYVQLAKFLPSTARMMCSVSL